MCSELVISFCVSLLTFRSPLHHLEPQSGSYWEDNKSSEIRQNLGAANSQSARQGESPQKIIHLKLSQFIPETGVGPRSSAEHKQEILSSCRDFVSEPPQLWRGQRQGVFKWVNSRFSFIRNIKTLITGLKNGHQRVPCNLLPSRKQVVPTALHNTSPFKPPSCCGLDHSILPSAMPGISLNVFSSLTAFLGHFSALALSALQGKAPPHPRGQRPEEKRRDADAVTSRCSKPVSDRLFVSAGLGWRCLGAFIQLDIHPQTGSIPNKARGRSIIL